MIKLAEFGLIYVAALSQIVDYRALEVFCCGFFLSRCLSGLSVVSFRSAKTDAFRLGSKQAVDELTLRLREDGYPVVSEPRMTGDGYYESCIAGIEGNLIEITE